MLGEFLGIFEMLKSEVGSDKGINFYWNIDKEVREVEFIFFFIYKFICFFF